MKKIIALFALVAAFCLGANAQNDPNRVIITESSGTYKSFMIERVDSIIFRTVEGRVAADVEFQRYNSGASGDTLWVGITLTDNCFRFKCMVIPANTMNYLSNEADLAAYIESNATIEAYSDFESAQLTGFEFKPNSDYVFATLGYDGWGTPCNTSTCSFHTPAPVIVGDPQVACTVDDVTANTFTISFVPNADVSSYSMCSFPEGELEMQFNMWGPMFGFSTIGEMIYMWGIPQTGDFTYTWTGMDPGKTYDVWVQPLDVNGNYAEPSCVQVTTTSLGGDGVAEVSIEVGEPIFDENIGATYIEVAFVSNEEAALFHAMLIEKSLYEEEWGEAGVLEYLKSDTDPYNPWNTYWDLYSEDVSYWSVNQGTDYIAFAIGKNALGEWGPLQSQEFSVPLMEAPTRKPATALAKRHNTGSGKMMMPKLNIRNLNTQPAISGK